MTIIQQTIWGIVVGLAVIVCLYRAVFDDSMPYCGRSYCELEKIEQWAKDHKKPIPLDVQCRTGNKIACDALIGDTQ